ncbi:MAG: thioredoxin family protein [SAR324 cluster bacterium]|nr:thioredoxin family protein [SAR324 cluster bacterium]
MKYRKISKRHLFEISLLAIFFFPATVFAQSPSSIPQIPEKTIVLSLELEPRNPNPGEHIRAIVKGELEPGWHIYSLVPAKDEFAPPPTKLTFKEAKNLEALGPFYETNPITANDPVIGMELNYHNNLVYFYQNLKLVDTAPIDQPVAIQVSIKYQTCSDKICLPPKTEILSTSFTPGSGGTRTEYTIPRYDINPLPGAVDAPGSLAGMMDDGFWQFIGLAVFSGFLALLTPCVFPMIPITVAFFTKQESASYSQVFRLSALFGVGIIGTYTITGMGLSVLLGATGAIQLATNGYVNFAIGILFTVFAFSLMGFFNLALPAGINNRMDQFSRQAGGSLGVILMGLVFTLTSFTCTVQFVGTLLIAASQGHWLWPIIGMLVFATVFALPFFLLGLIPQLIQTMQSQSGAWLSNSKIVLGLLELAAAFKFYSNADLVWQWGIVDRDFVLYAWIILAFLAGAFLLGMVTIKNIRVDKTGAAGFTVAFCFLLLGFYLTKGLHGTPLHGLVDAYLPPELSTSKNLVSSSSVPNQYYVDQVHALPWLHDLPQALSIAKKEGKLIFVDFTGYTCVNCRWMEKHIFANPQVLDVFKQKFVLVQLYTDGGDNYEANQAMQLERFHTLALPFYVVLDQNDRVVARHSGIISNSEKFLAFLRQKSYSTASINPSYSKL